MRLIIYGLCLFLWCSDGLWAQTGPTQPRRVTVSGYVREAGSDEALLGASVYLPGTSTGTTTNPYGFYSLTLPAQDSLRLAFSLVGYEPVTRELTLQRDQSLTVRLRAGQVLNTVEVRGNRADERVSETPQMSKIEVPVSQIKKIPAFLGEKDVLRVLQLMPGVQKGSEGQTGIYVRGGGPDQNLIILDEAVVYNASHLFGFFSVFNGDALKSVELLKGGFPARYGGRLSSVIELNMKDGNKEKLHGEGGIGLIASRLTLEGPFAKNKKGSFLVSGRRTYLDVLAAPLISRGLDGGSAGYYFYDLNAKANYDIDAKNKVYLSGYFGRDRFFVESRDGTKVGLGWGNATGTLRWNHLINQKLFANLSLIHSSYDFTTTLENKNATGDIISLRYGSDVTDWGAKLDIDYYPSPAHALRFGMQTTWHRFRPSALVFNDPSAETVRIETPVVEGIESAIYAEDTWRATDRLRLNGGLRLSLFNAPTVNYVRPEPRLSASYQLAPGLSAKASGAIMNQYVHLLSNTGIGLPTDLWVLTTDRVAPQQSQQVAVGLARDFSDRFPLGSGFALTLEGYYKSMRNIINYKEGASFLLLDDPESAEQIRWEDNITTGRGWSYGAEVMLQRKAGRLSGWVGYTLSWTQWQFADLNGGRPFYPRYDRRHDLSVVGIYELSKRVTLSATWVYGTGNALTLPVANYTAYLDGPFSGSLFDFGRGVTNYSPQKNDFRAEPYHRFDVSLQVRKQKKRHERTWEFSIYNAYNRANPFFYQLEAQNNQTRLFRYSVFPIVPSISYNFKF
jgi:hypothetical protein